MASPVIATSPHPRHGARGVHLDGPVFFTRAEGQAALVHPLRRRQMKTSRLGILTVSLTALWLLAPGCGHRSTEEGDNDLQVALLQNKSGKFVAYSTEAAQAALASAPMPDDLIA